MFLTDQHSLEFWIRLRGRLTTAFEDGRARLAEYRNMVFPATVNDPVLQRNRAASERAAALTQLTELSSLRVLMLSLDGQLAFAAHSVELPFLESQMACLRDAIDLYRSSVCGLPQRRTSEDDLEDFSRQYELLRNAGNGEHATNERQRLRDQSVPLRVLGREDGAPYEDECRNYETDLDHLATRVQHLKATTLVALNVPEASVKVLAGFGVKVFQQAAPALPNEASDSGDAQAALAPPVAANEDTSARADTAAADRATADVQA